MVPPIDEAVLQGFAEADEAELATLNRSGRRFTAKLRRKEMTR
jgi:hypothetical protein